MEPPDTAELSRDQIFDVLSSERRRYVLFHLSREGGSLPMQDLSRDLAAWENDVPVEEVTSEQRKRVYVSLYQTHVPKLQEIGVVEYDEDGTVRLTDRAQEVTTYLGDGTSDRPWPLYYAVLSLVGTSILVGAAVDFSVLGTVSDLTVGAVVIGSFVLLSVAYVLSGRSQLSDVSEFTR